MALTTYAELFTAVKTWLARADVDPFIADWITMFEAYANRKLRVRQMETSTTLSPEEGESALPADYLAWRRLTYTGDPRGELSFVHPSYLQASYPTTPAGIPNVFTIEGSTLKIRPTSETELELDYWQKIPALSGEVNWLYTAHPDLYLFGTLTEAADMLELDDKLIKWKTRRDELVDEIEKLSRQTVGPASIRIFGATP